MRRLPAFLALALLLAGGALADTLDGVAAVVDDQVILLSEVQAGVRRMAARLEQQQGPLPPEALGEVQRRVISSLIDDRLVLVVAKKNQMELAPGEVDQAITGIAQEEGISVDDVYAAVEREGLSREAYRQQISDQILRMRVIDQAVRSRVTVSEEEMRELYQARFGSAAPGVRVRARHILLAWEGDGEESRAATRARAREIREQALAGASFAELAQRWSAAPSAPEGGATLFREGEVAPELSAFVFSAEPGSTSEPLETTHGVNLVQVGERFDPSTVKFEDARPRLAAELTSKKMGPELDRFLKELRKKHYVEVVDPALR